jgi:hypothetical protein
LKVNLRAIIIQNKKKNRVYHLIAELDDILEKSQYSVAVYDVRESFVWFIIGNLS